MKRRDAGRESGDAVPVDAGQRACLDALAQSTGLTDRERACGIVGRFVADSQRVHDAVALPSLRRAAGEQQRLLSR